MNIYYVPPEHEYYIKRAREMRSEAWRNIFTRIAGMPTNLVGRVSEKVRSAIEDKRVAP